jgi:hypothetical protein
LVGDSTRKAEERCQHRGRMSGRVNSALFVPTASAGLH